MNDPPGTVPPAESPHPRRPPAHKSVSLRHSPPRAQLPKGPSFHQPGPASPNSLNAPASDKANPPSSVSPKKHSSGESSDAGKWFERTNNNAEQSNASFADNDPPFFLPNSSSSETPPEGHASRERTYQQTSAMPYRPGLARLGTDGSSTDDFRSVIDDLTVANKKLKLKLKKYEKLYDAHLQDEKLFEVRFHGLPDHKKRELEETLRKFAAELHDTPQTNNPSAHQPPPFDAQRTASSHTSRFAESGYASLSASGQNSISVPSIQALNQLSNQNLHQNPAHDGDRRRMTKSQYNRQQQSIQSYLHDIPAGLLPKSHAPMTEKSKKKLVVRRMEQVFAGKRSAPGNHQQPMQQEEVAQSAAMADRQAKEATGQHYKTEGHREARMVTERANYDDAIGEDNSDTLQRFRPNLNISEQDLAGSGSGSPDQRPTRPLDLDPYRAQVPTENMEYIRHLGFTPPDVATGEAPQDGHGWLYLNLLINMAQLHTLNVTPDFVKDAVTEYSSKFELSHDGRRIRWRGGRDLTLSSSDSSSEQLSNSAYSNVATSNSNTKSPKKRSKSGYSKDSGSTLDLERKARRLARAQKEKEQSKFAYTPIFFHREESEEDNYYYGFDVGGSSSNSPFLNQQAGDSSGFGSSAIRSSSSKMRRDDGPIIFYNKAKFCTDLSGDRRGLSKPSSDYFVSTTTQPLGVVPTPPSPSRQSTSDSMDPRVRLEDSLMDIDPEEGIRTSSSEEDIHFSPDELKNDNGTESPDIIEFEASGLGGVQPEDNFSIRVRRSQTITATSGRRRKSQLYQKRIIDALSERATSTTRGASASHQQHNPQHIREEILSASRKSLPSSTLPPASFLPFDTTSSGDVDSDLDDDSDVSSNPSSTESSDNGPATALQLLNISPLHQQIPVGGEGAESSSSSSSEKEEEEEEEEESENDDSIDFLATARRVDPSTIRASEREYDAVVADRLAEEIPAGSSAATAGGGSGFNSPLSAVGEASRSEENEYRSSRARAKRHSTTSGSLSSRAQLKRARPRDSQSGTLQNSKAPKSQKIE